VDVRVWIRGHRKAAIADAVPMVAFKAGEIDHPTTKGGQ
jgi:hypothetical protein